MYSVVFAATAHTGQTKRHPITARFDFGMTRSDWLGEQTRLF